MVAAATIAAMPMVHLETRAFSVSRPRACAPSISNRAAVDLCGLCFFPELGLERATTPCPHSVFTTTSRDADMAGDEPISWRILLLLAMTMEFLHRFLSAPGKLLSPNYSARWRWLHCGILIRQSRSLGGVGSMPGLPESGRGCTIYEYAPCRTNALQQRHRHCDTHISIRVGAL